ncbi:MAG: zinc ribbon domain-containing protein [Victivallales bacterium]|nr:zinc ribbon domain-containing protein [Victivallales bacterium]
MDSKKLQTGWRISLMINTSLLLLVGLYLVLYAFVFNDFREVPAPDYSAFQEKYVTPEVRARENTLSAKLRRCEAKIDGCRENGNNYRQSATTYRQTVQQLLDANAGSDLVKQSLEQFYQIQKRQAANNEAVIALTAEKQSLQEQLKAVNDQLDAQHRRGIDEYHMVYHAFRMRLAFIQLGILLPLLLLSVGLAFRFRTGMVFRLLLPFAAATLIQTGLTMHEYFPSRFFKYVLLLALIGVVVGMVIYLLRLQLKPRRGYLLKKYREAYFDFLCPICNYPIRSGVRRFRFWTRASLRREQLPEAAGMEDNPEYFCPHCGEHLFEVCPACGKVRHSLLPFCEHCGAEKKI